MNNAELIKALQCKTNDVNDCTTCAYRNACYGGTLELIAADALEAAEKRIKELEAQMPKEGEWIPNSPFTGNCSECGGDGNLKDKYCPNCGAKMKGEQK